MASIKRWVSRIIDRSLARFSAASPIAQSIQQKFLHDLRQQARYSDPKRLTRFEHQVFSQGGEDGALREIFRRLGETDRGFVELGVGNGIENNTAFLLLQGWNGLWLEGSAKSCKAIRESFARELGEGKLKLVEALITRDNAANLVLSNMPSPTFDLLSIDVDRNTYHVWEALDVLRPRVVVVEYNALYPGDMHWIAEYDPDKSWNGTTYFGASLKALEQLGSRMGYNLVGCDIAGANAFFVRGDLCGDKFCAPFTAENHYEPIRYFLHARVGHRPVFRD
jgi:hypothetical protein